MASYLRPRRGSLANAKTQLTASNPLKSGEVFFECENIGKSQGKIKLGDATTTYSSLPYFLSMQDSSIGFTNSTNSVSTADSSFLNSSILSTSAHSTVMYAVKQLLWNHTQKIAALNNNKVPTTRTINGKALSANISLTASDINLQTKTALQFGSADTRYRIINGSVFKLDDLGLIFVKIEGIAINSMSSMSNMSLIKIPGTSVVSTLIGYVSFNGFSYPKTTLRQDSGNMYLGQYQQDNINPDTEIDFLGIFTLY